MREKKAGMQRKRKEIMKVRMEKGKERKGHSGSEKYNKKAEEKAGCLNEAL